MKPSQVKPGQLVTLKGDLGGPHTFNGVIVSRTGMGLHKASALTLVQITDTNPNGEPFGRVGLSDYDVSRRLARRAS